MYTHQRDLWPYLAPYLTFLCIVELSGRLGATAEAWLLPLRVVVPGALLIYFARKGAYPELSGLRLRVGGVLADVAAGLVIAAVWVGPYLAGWLERGGEPFEPSLYGESGVALVLGLRLVGFALVTPFMEELFVRSFVHRLADAWWQGKPDFRELPVGVFAPAGFVVTTLWFTFTHVSWEWPVAAVCGVLFNLWLYARGHLGAAVIAHAVTNGSIWLAVVAGPVDLWDFL
ncbi:MAG: CAAX prenyl protease-related protein [Myxococcota bacterium]|nr:CAAX prenyl protease-related protein [Myxococcota bacterium]